MSRTRSRIAVLVAAAALALTACGGDAPETTPTEESPAETTESPAETETPTETDAPETEAGAFPVTITSALGDAVIEAAPERVVTLGWGADDIALSLGVVPVGIEIDTWGGDADGYRPWFREAVEAQGAELPAVITMYPELDVDAVIALEPDLVLAPQSGLDQAVFDQLSAFVPVVAYPGGPWGTSIEDQVTIAGQALGQPELAETLLAEREQAIADAAAELSDAAGTTFAYIFAGIEPGTLAAYLPGDPRVELLRSLGLELDPAVADLEADPGAFTATLGLENADLLDDVDLLFTWFNSVEEQEATEAQPLFAQIPAFANGNYLPMLDRSLGMAVSVATPLSVPWALDAYVPMIQEALAGTAG